MKTAVEWLVDEMIQRKFFEKETELSYTTLEHLTNQAKEIEKEQLECAWNSSDQNMRFQFSSSAYKAITFKQWLEKFKQEKDVINR